MGKEDQLEFISVQQDDDDNITSPLNPYSSHDHNNSWGSWLLLGKSKHPSAVFFHLLFKAIALLFYVFGSWFTSNFIFVFVICIILLAFDFWTVKNISGRLLVGLRWWSYVRDDGNNEWIFESLEDMAELSPFDANIFWGALYVTPIIWTLFLIVGLLRLKFEYIPIIIAAIIMNGANIFGYIKCSSSAKNKMKSMMDQGMKAGSMAALENSTLRNFVFSTLLSVTSNSSQNSVPGNIPSGAV